MKEIICRIFREINELISLTPQSRVVFNHKAHRELWDWLSRNPHRERRDWPGWNKYNLLPIYLCFACQYEMDISGDSQSCVHCPLVWPDGECSPDDTRGLFDKWESARSPWAKSRLAEKIRDLPVRKGIQCV